MKKAFKLKFLAKVSLVVIMLVMTSCITRTIIVTCPQSGARIEADGVYLASKQAEIKMKKGGWKSIKISAPHYISQTFTINRHSEDTIKVCLESKDVIEEPKAAKDDSWEASAPASDIANKKVRIVATSSNDDDEIWYILIRYASDYFDDFSINDKNVGWARTTWATRTFNRIKVRTRLEIKRNPSNKKEFTICLSSQYSNLLDCREDECYEEWDRVLKSYLDLPSSLSTAIQ